MLDAKTSQLILSDTAVAGSAGLNAFDFVLAHAVGAAFAAQKAQGVSFNADLIATDALALTEAVTKKVAVRARDLGADIQVNL